MNPKFLFSSAPLARSLHPEEMAVVQQRFGILWCEDSAKWTGQWSLYVNALGEHDSEVWEVFHVCEGQLPSLDAIHNYTGTMAVGAL
jgi:hypothetical protein